MELLRVGDEQSLAALAVGDPRTARHLLGRLWDADEGVRRRSARALGVATACYPDMGIEVARRLMWGLNDESATNGRDGIPALAEIGFRNPRLIAPFVAPLASLVWDDGLRLEIVRALTRIAAAAPELVRPVCRQVAECVDTGDPTEHAALGRLLEVCGGFDEA